MKRCETSDLPGLLDFYRLVIRDTDDIAAHARWEFGKHPTEALLADYVSRGMHTFSEDEWYKRTGMANQQLRNLLRTLTNKGIIIELGEKGHKRFWIAYSDK